MGGRVLAIILIVIILAFGFLLVAPQLFKGIVPEQYIEDTKYDTVSNIEIQWQDEAPEVKQTIIRDSGAIIANGASSDPFEVYTEDVFSVIDETSEYEVTELSHSDNNDPIYTTVVTTAATTATAKISDISAETTATIATTKAVTTRGDSDDNWATLPDDIQEVIISETFEGSLSDYFH